MKAQLYEHTDLSRRAAQLKRRVRREGRARGASIRTLYGWSLRVSDRGAQLVVEYFDTKNLGIQSYTEAL